MFSQSQNIITGGTFNTSQQVVNVNETHFHNANGFECLQHAASPSAFHNSGHIFDPPKCHPNTRVAVLEKITKWVDGAEDPDAPVMWINGSAGVGKSAIARTMAERLAEEKRLVASFFFSRTDPSRNNAGPFIPTIAYHAAIHIPQLGEPIFRAVEQNPLIFKLSLDAQFSSFLTQPIQDLAKSGYFSSTSSPRVIIIDGLDECEDLTAQVSILNVIANVLRKAHLPLLFLIVSRPEQHLSMAFNFGSMKGLHTRLTLDGSFFPDLDIRFFLEDRFEDIRQSHPLRAYIPSGWPAPEHVKTLIFKSSGQFIYASTVIKYISSTRHRPNRRLDIILGIQSPRNENPFSELDALYMHIFSSLEVDNIDLVRAILAFHMLQLVDEWSVAQMEQFLSLEPGDIGAALCDLGSLVCIEEWPLGEFIRVLHASLRDFLFDPTRSHELYLNSPLRHAAYARRYLEMFKIPDYDLPGPLWHRELIENCKRAALTPELRQDILDFSLQNVRANVCKETDSGKMELWVAFRSDFLEEMKLRSDNAWP